MTTAQAARLKAALLAFECKCDRCKKRPALRLFDQSFLCRPCYRVMYGRLMKEGRKVLWSV